MARGVAPRCAVAKPEHGSDQIDGDSRAKLHRDGAVRPSMSPMKKPKLSVQARMMKKPKMTFEIRWRLCSGPCNDDGQRNCAVRRT